MQKSIIFHFKFEQKIPNLLRKDNLFRWLKHLYNYKEKQQRHEHEQRHNANIPIDNTSVFKLINHDQ